MTDDNPQTRAERFGPSTPGGVWPRTQDAIMVEVDTIMSGLDYDTTVVLRHLILELTDRARVDTNRATVVALADQVRDTMAGMGGSSQRATLAWRVQADLTRGAILVAGGCTCTPGARSGRMAPAYPEDMRCPLHRDLVTR